LNNASWSICSGVFFINHVKVESLSRLAKFVCAVSVASVLCFDRQDESEGGKENTGYIASGMLRNFSAR
jgi:hypothetical protein